MLKGLLTSNKNLALMLIKAQKDVFSSISGENSSKKKGLGYDFVELREYESGDDIKHIDWIISSKMDKPHVKLFHEQKELNIVIVPILSASLNFGLKVLKKDVVSEVCALISFSALKQNNPFESYIHNDKLTLTTQKTKHLFAVRELVENVHEYDSFFKELNYKKLSKELYERLKQKSLIFLIGDFFEANDLDINALGIKHELIVIIVRDRFEEEPKTLGNVYITDPISNKGALINLNKKAIKTIKEKVIKEDEALYKKLKKVGVKFVKIYTDENSTTKILNLMREL